ncbi:MAG TPA: phosphoglucosamine mutase, partial [Firmicutes bacterium]|nr:phosphoglucosamine mutase [Bacillota bacterium]
MNKLFGTDGIRGVANQELTPELALRIGRAGALVLGKGSRCRLLIGRDPRISGQMLEGALAAGIASAGVDVISVGVVPTPAVAYLTQKLDCCGGAMISASHNPLQDNGIKFFGADGHKLADSREAEIEALIPQDNHPRPTAGGVGRIHFKPEAVNLYLGDLRKRLPLNLRGLKIALDCAHGATAQYAPKL